MFVRREYSMSDWTVLSFPLYLHLQVLQPLLSCWYRKGHRFTHGFCSTHAEPYDSGKERYPACNYRLDNYYSENIHPGSRIIRTGK